MEDINILIQNNFPSSVDPTRSTFIISTKHTDYGNLLALYDLNKKYEMKRKFCIREYTFKEYQKYLPAKISKIPNNSSSLSSCSCCGTYKYCQCCGSFVINENFIINLPTAVII